MKIYTNTRDTLLQIIDSNLTMSTREVLRDIGFIAFTADDYEVILNRFEVRSISHCKDDQRMPHHEFLIVELIDKQNDSESHFLILERTSSEVRSDDPPGGIVKNLKESQIFKSLSRSTERLSLYQAPNDTDSSLQLPLLDASTLAFTGASRASSYSISPIYLANDTFRGGESVESYAKSTRNVRQITPSGFSFFDLVVLANSIHEQEPNYSILGTQCFWFASLICNIVEQEYVCSDIITGPSSSSGGSVGNPIRPTDYLPDISGRVKGVLITRPDIEATQDLVAKFRECLAFQRESVSLLLIILNSSY
jgi:hypothetical protein